MKKTVKAFAMIRRGRVAPEDYYRPEGGGYETLAVFKSKKNLSGYACHGEKIVPCTITFSV